MSRYPQGPAPFGYLRDLMADREEVAEKQQFVLDDEDEEYLDDECSTCGRSPLNCRCDYDYESARDDML